MMTSKERESFPHTRTVPATGTREEAWLDFKEVPSKLPNGTLDRYEIAKDVAAMANSVGGTILFFTSRKGDTLGGFVPKTQADALQLARMCEEAVQQRCLPPPIIECEPLPNLAGTGFVLAVHVHPLYSVVATRVDGSKDDGHNGTAWTFWIRVGSQSKDTTPEVIAMSKPEVRRTANLLRRMKATDGVAELLVRGQAVPRLFRNLKVTDVNEDDNVVVFEGGEERILYASNAGSGAGMEAMKAPFRHPLDFVESVFRDGPDWKIVALDPQAAR
jgi:Putative DNA-binding domain